MCLRALAVVPSESIYSYESELQPGCVRGAAGNTHAHDVDGCSVCARSYWSHLAYVLEEKYQCPSVHGTAASDESRHDPKYLRSEGGQLAEIQDDVAHMLACRSTTALNRCAVLYVPSMRSMMRSTVPT